MQRRIIAVESNFSLNDPAVLDPDFVGGYLLAGISLPQLNLSSRRRSGFKRISGPRVTGVTCHLVSSLMLTPSSNRRP